MLTLRHADHQSVELLAHRDLARQARIEFTLGGKAQHARLLRPWHRSPGLVEPGRIDIDMAGGAGTLAAAIGVDAGHVVVDRTAHHRETDRHLHRMFGAVVYDVGYLGHRRPLYNGSQENASPERSSGINEGLSAGKACSAI